MKVTIENLEAYLGKMYCGRSSDSGLFMKLVEEMGEVAETLNMRDGRKAGDESDTKAELGKELADMIHYIVAIAAVNGLDLNGIIIEKDRQAAKKYNHSINLEQFIQERGEKN